MLSALNLYSGNSYILDGSAYLSLTNNLWKSNFFKDLFSNYTNRAGLVIDCILYPFKISTLNNLNVATNQSRDIYIGDRFLTLDYGNVYTINGINSNTLPFKKFSFNRETLDTILTKSFLDYGTITEYSLYLPFIGFKDIDYDVIAKSNNIGIDYFVDVSTGVLLANTYSVLNSGERIRIYEDSIDIGFHLTITGSDGGVKRDALLNMASIVVGVAGTLTGQPYMTTVAASNVVNNISSKSVKKSRNPETGRLNTNKFSESYKKETNDYTSNSKSFSSPYHAYGATINGLNDLFNARVPTSIRSSSGQSVSVNSLSKPYILYKRPTALYYTGYNHSFGRPLNDFKKISELKGYTIFSNIHITIPALSEEIAEISDLLLTGVIINNVLEPSPEPQPTPTPTPPIPEPVEPPPPLPEGEVATMLCCFNGKFKVTQTMHSQHVALDLVGLDSQVVRAISSGYIENRYQEGGAGYYVRQRLDNGNFIYYMHLQKNSFKSGNKQYVAAGTPLGIMGNTGNSDGAHTHLELRAGNATTPLDICAFTGIPNKEGIYIGSSTYKNPETAALQSAVGLENQTMNYIDNYTYSKDLSSKILEKINNK